MWSFVSAYSCVSMFTESIHLLACAHVPVPLLIHSGFVLVGNRVSLNVPSFPGINYVNQAGLELSHPPSSPHPTRPPPLGLKMCTTTPGLAF